MMGEKGRGKWKKVKERERKYEYINQKNRKVEEMMVHVLEEVIIKPRLTPHTHFENIHVTKNKTVIQLEIVIGKKMLLATHMLFSFLE